MHKPPRLDVDRSKGINSQVRFVFAWYVVAGQKCLLTFNRFVRDNKLECILTRNCQNKYLKIMSNRQ